MRKFNIIAFLVFIALSFMFLNPGQLPADETASDNVRVGAILPLSGFGAPWGIATLRAFELMVDKINAEGGVKVGDKQYPIQLVKADTKTDYNVAVAQTNRLIFHEKIKFIFGPMMSGSTLAVLPLTERNEILTMAISIATPKILGPDKKYCFRLMASMRERMVAIYDYLAKYHPDLKTIALIGPNDETGWDTSDFGKKQAVKFGYEVVFDDLVQQGTSDFFPILTKMVPKNPHVLVPHGLSQGSVALLLQQAHQLGYKGFIISVSHYDHNKLVSKAGAEAVEGFIFQSPTFTGPESLPAHRELYESYMKKYKEELNPIAAAGYCYPLVFKLALEKAGSFDTTVVARAMEELEGEYAFGHFSFGGLETYGAKHQILEPIFMSVIKGGKLIGLGSVRPEVP